MLGSLSAGRKLMIGGLLREGHKMRGLILKVLWLLCGIMVSAGTGYGLKFCGDL